jgi:hypothetical protein
MLFAAVAPEELAPVHPSVTVEGVTRVARELVSGLLLQLPAGNVRRIVSAL